MSDDRSSEMAARVRAVATGLAETGLARAEEMVRRVSPAGRAEARRAREARRRANRPVWLAVITAIVILAAMALVGAPGSAILLSTVLMTALIALLWFQTRPRPVTTEILVRRTPLAQLPAQANAWLAEQRRALPAPAARLTDTLARRLDELAPQLQRLSPDTAAADAVRKLVATELPDLINGFGAVPVSMRGDPRPDGRTAEAHLVEGLRLIDGELARMTTDLARGALDDVATQGRYLQLKYRGED